MFRKPDGAGKGDAPRPVKDWEQFEKNFDAIFGKKKQPDPKETFKTLADFSELLDKKGNEDDKQRSDDASKQDEESS
jgi:hypothetical protein